MARQNTNTVGSQQLTVDSTSGGVALTLPTGAKRALMTLADAQIRFLDDGTAPTTTLGHVVDPKERIDYMDDNYQHSLGLFRAIRTGATSGVLDITYYD